MASRRLVSSSGFYRIDADVNEPDIFKAYLGDNLPSLLRITHQYRSCGLF